MYSFGEYVMVLIDLVGSDTMFFKYYYVITLLNLSSLNIKLELHVIIIRAVTNNIHIPNCDQNQHPSEL